MKYYSTFISGFDELILKLINKDINAIQNITIFDGAVSYETNCEINYIKSLRYFNNSFIILNENNNNNLDNYLDYLLTQNINFKNLINKEKTFKIFSSIENQLVSPNGGLIAKLVDKIEKPTKLKYSSIYADCEFWLMSRSEQVSLFLFRITENKKQLNKGELKIELANLLCQIVEPVENEIILDPFCGSGAIMLERSKSVNFKGIFANDKNEILVSELKKKIKKIKNTKLQKSFFVKCEDFFHNSFKDNFIDTIITDPPWGLFETIDEDFYINLLKESHRILKNNGKLILLSAKKDFFEKTIENFKIIKQYNILVSGKKAGVYLLINQK